MGLFDTEDWDDKAKDKMTDIGDMGKDKLDHMKHHDSDDSGTSQPAAEENSI